MEEVGNNRWDVLYNECIGQMDRWGQDIERELCFAYLFLVIVGLV
jgi:hypothetical protein